MRNGFRYIKELVLQQFNHFLNSSYNTLKQNNIEVYSVKTDAFTIKATDAEAAKSLILFNNNIGSWRISKTENIIYPTMKYESKINMNIDIKPLVVNHLIVPDEYDTEYMCKLFIEHRRVMIRADYAGCGKSYAAGFMEKLGYKVLFVYPTRKLVQDRNKQATSKEDENGTTLNMFFSVGMTEETKISKFDDSAYDVVVFDEIYFSSIQMLTKIKKYSEDNPDKIILATGDSVQLESIDLLSDQIDYDIYSNHCIDTIFNNTIQLTENKRLKTDEDKQKLKDFKTDIFNEKKPIIQTIKKYFKLTSDIDTINNIAFTNETCNMVSKTVRANLKKTEDYEIGETLICRKYLKIGKTKFNVNYEYEIVKVFADSVMIKDTAIRDETLACFLQYLKL